MARKEEKRKKAGKSKAAAKGAAAREAAAEEAVEEAVARGAAVSYAADRNNIEPAPSCSSGVHANNDSHAAVAADRCPRQATPLVQADSVLQRGASCVGGADPASSHSEGRDDTASGHTCLAGSDVMLGALCSHSPLPPILRHLQVGGAGRPAIPLASASLPMPAVASAMRAAPMQASAPPLAGVPVAPYRPFLGPRSTTTVEAAAAHQVPLSGTASPAAATMLSTEVGAPFISQQPLLQQHLSASPSNSHSEQPLMQQPVAPPESQQPSPASLILPQQQVAALSVSPGPSESRPAGSPLGTLITPVTGQKATAAGHAEEGEDDDSRLCVVCMEAPCSVLLAPCGHTVLCRECCEGIRVSSNQVIKGWGSMEVMAAVLLLTLPHQVP